MKYFDEALLEPIVRKLRFSQGLKIISRNKPFTLVDLGCGPKICFYKTLQEEDVPISTYIGIDPLVDINMSGKEVYLIAKPVNGRIPLPDNNVEYVVGFAFLEHLTNPEIIIKESLRILKPGGKAIFTAPSVTLQPILEILAFVGLISKREIAEHKWYFNRKKLLALVPKQYQNKAQHRYFQFGLNNLLVIFK